MTFEEAIAKWTTEVFDQDRVIDPDRELDWESIAIGYMLGLGFSIKEVGQIYDILFKRFLV